MRYIKSTRDFSKEITIYLIGSKYKMKEELILSNLNLIGYDYLSEDNLYNLINGLEPIYINSFDDYLSLIRDIKINKLLKKESSTNIVINYLKITGNIKYDISFRNYVNNLKKIAEDCKITIITSIYQDIGSYNRYKFRTPESILYMAKTAYQIIDNKIFVVKQNIKNDN